MTKEARPRAQAIAKSEYVHPSDELWQRFLIAATDPDLPAILAFLLIGLLLTLIFMFRFPDFGAIIAQANQF